MRTRTSLILAVLAVLVLAAGLMYGIGPREQSHDTATGALAFPGLADKLSSVTKVEIIHAGETLPIERKPDATVWGLADHDGYRAQQDKVRELLTGLTELKLSEPRTSDPAEYARLGVEDPAGTGTDSTLLRVLDANGGALAALIVGHDRPQAGGRGDSLYVRRPAEPQAWLAEGHLPTVANDAQSWLDRDLLNIDHARIAGLTVSRDGQTLTFAKQGNVLGLTAPAEHPKLDGSLVGAVGRSLEQLRLEDVRRAAPESTPLGEAVFTTTDGLTLTVTARKAGRDLWATFAVTGNDAAKPEADKLAAVLSGWAFELPAGSEAAMLPKLDDLKAAPPPAQ